MKILVLGAGQVAHAVCAASPLKHQVIAKARAELDITDSKAVHALVTAEKPDWVVNAAAYTAVDLAQTQPEQAAAVNEIAVGALDRAARDGGGRLLHLSTDFVFDGLSNRAYLTTDPTNPLSVYGSTKLAGERRVIDGGTGIVMRTSWVYASAGKNFVLTMLRLMREREQISVVSDQIGSPTWAGSIAATIWSMLEGNAAPAIYHWTDLGVASWYDFAVAIQEEALSRGLLSRAIPIQPIPTSAYPTPAKRPAFSVLDSLSTRTALNMKGQHWRHNLRVMMDELRAA